MMLVNCTPAQVNSGIVRQNSLWDFLIFKQIRKLLGGNVRLLITGSAPIAPSVLQWWVQLEGFRIDKWLYFIIIRLI